MKKLQPAKNGLHGSLMVPGDKSISHRAIMIGALSTGTTIVNHFLNGNDCLSTLRAFHDLGVRIKQNDDQVIIDGQGIDALHQANHSLDMGNSGTTTRLMMGILAGRQFDTRLIGDQSLEKRPMKRVSEPLRSFGGQVNLSENGTLPALIRGQKLHAANYTMKVASAQVKSALIFAALQTNGISHIQELLPTRDHTEIMLNQFGADIVTDNNHQITVHPHPQLKGQTVEVPGDISSAAFFLVAAAIVPNSKVTLKHVNLNPTRTGIIDALQKMGANLSIETLPSQGEPQGNITITTSKLRPIEIGKREIPAVVDELPLVALLAACADGQSKITGAEELRVKETDRIKTVVQELHKLGVKVKELPDGMIINGQPEWHVQDDQLTSYGDHRIGMMDAIAALKAKQQLQLAKPEAIAVSYPGFFDDLAKLTEDN